MKKYIFILCLSIYSITAFSQHKVTGRILDENNYPIDLAKVIMSVNDSIIQETFTNPNGEFSLMANDQNYKFVIYYIGEVIFKKDLVVNGNIDLGVIKSQKILKLAEVNIVGKRKVIERKIDRLVFNLDRTILSSGGDAIDALKITPGVRLKGEEISLVGKDRLQVMIDGKIVNMSGDNLNDFLRSISSDNIKSIEVITTPPAKYEAEGNSGMLNIILKKNNINNWNATLGTSYTQRTYGTKSITGNLNYNKNKVSIYSNFNLSDGYKRLDDNNQVYYPSNLWSQNNPRKAGNTSFSGRIGLGYDVSKIWSTDLQYLGSVSDIRISDNPLTSISNYLNGGIDSYISSTSKTDKKPSLNSITWNNAIKLDTNGSNILVSLDYFRFNNSDSRNYNGNSLDKNGVVLPNTYFAAINSNNQKITNYSVKIDGQSKSKLVDLDFGYKYSSSETNNSIRFFNNDSGVEKLDTNNTNYFKYNEKIHAVYISGNKKFDSKWESKVGLRAEYTRSMGISENNNQTTKNSYVQFFPTAYLSYTANENNNFSFAYSRRIDRPKFEQLNPFKAYDSPYIYTEGNPFLQPSFTNNLELVYAYKALENKFYFSNKTAGFEQFGIADPNTNITRFFVDNFLTSRKFGISESYTYDKVKWWTSSNSLDFNYAVSHSSNPVTAKQRNGYSSYISSYNDFNLNKAKSMALSVNYWYSLPGVDGLDKVSSANSLSLAFKLLLLNKNLQITIAGNDIFGTERYTLTSYTNDIKLVYRNYYDNRSFRFGVSYKFGNQKIKVNSGKTGNEDERLRTAN